MAKKIVFEFDGEPVAWELNKVDRSRLYGFKEQQVLDENGDLCDLATLSDDGKTLVGKGGTGIGYLTADGNWTDKSKLVPVNLEGEEITPVPSSFAAPIKLTTEISVDEYLNHNIRLIYRLTTETAIPEGLFTELADGRIFGFDYSYRGGLEADHGFLLMNDAKEVFFLVGDPTSVDYVGLQQSAAIAATEDEPESESDLMDFGMI